MAPERLGRQGVLSNEWYWANKCAVARGHSANHHVDQRRNSRDSRYAARCKILSSSGFHSALRWGRGIFHELSRRVLLHEFDRTATIRELVVVGSHHLFSLGCGRRLRKGGRSGLVPRNSAA